MFWGIVYSWYKYTYIYNMILFYSWWLNPTDLCFVGFDLTDIHGSNLPKMGHHLSSRSAYHDRVAYSKSERHMALWEGCVFGRWCEMWKVTQSSYCTKLEMGEKMWFCMLVLLVGWWLLPSLLQVWHVKLSNKIWKYYITYYVYYNLYFICTYFSFHSRKVSDQCRHARCNDYRIWK